MLVINQPVMHSLYYPATHYATSSINATTTSAVWLMVNQIVLLDDTIAMMRLPYHITVNFPCELIGYIYIYISICGFEQQQHNMAKLLLPVLLVACLCLLAAPSSERCTNLIGLI